MLVAVWCTLVTLITSAIAWTAPERLELHPAGVQAEAVDMVLSPDGQWLSFSRRYGAPWPTTTDAETYWLDAAIIEDLRGD